jgi:hypothetical protein
VVYGMDQNSGRWRGHVNAVKNFRVSYKNVEFLDLLKNCYLLYRAAMSAFPTLCSCPREFYTCLESGQPGSGAQLVDSEAEAAGA